MSNNDWNNNNDGSDGWNNPPQGQNDQGLGQQQGGQPNAGGWGNPAQPGQSAPQDQGWNQPQGQQQLQTTPQSSPSGKKAFPKLDGNDIVILAVSFFLPGIGHVMLGQTKKGLAILAAVIFTCGIGYIVTIAIVADAFLCLAKKKEVGQLEEWEFFPNYSDYM